MFEFAIKFEQYSLIVFLTIYKNMKETNRMDTNTNNIYRDVTMDNISESNVGQTMKICGWVENHP